MRTHGAVRHPVENGFPAKGGPGGEHDLSEPSAIDLQFSPTGLSGQLPAGTEKEEIWLIRSPALASSPIIGITISTS